MWVSTRDCVCEREKETFSVRLRGERDKDFVCACVWYTVG